MDRYRAREIDDQRRAARQIVFGVIALIAWMLVPDPIFLVAPLQAQPIGQAQRVVDDENRAPRFFLASMRSGRAPDRVDVNEVPALKRRISITLTSVTLEAALNTIAELGAFDIAYSRTAAPLDQTVRLDARDITVGAALTEVLLDADVDVVFSRSGRAMLVPCAAPTAHVSEVPAVGAIVGRVTDAESGAGLAGANVRVEGTGLGAVTGNTGRYRIADVPAGTHTIGAQQLGYAQAGQSVTVSDGGEATADFALEVAALPMDEVVATGTAFETRMRTVPNPISVITAREIERKQATNITDLLRGEIPGVMSLTPGQLDYRSYIYVRGNMGGSTGDFIKTYIDGVEVANSQHLSTIDPKSIERIEVVRGPQASAIYGSEAASGVLQIFTKKGTPGLARPSFSLQTSVGAVESDYTPADAGTPLTQDYSLEVNGGGESFSYRAGASYGTVGEWLTGYDSETLGFSGGLRAVQGPLTAELTALWSDRELGTGNSPIFLSLPVGACGQCGNPDYVDNRDHDLSQNTMGLKLTYQATPKWQHTLTLGDDQNRWAYHQPEPNHNTPADTFVALYNQESRRRSVRYQTAYDAEWVSWATTRFTGGVDYWSYDVQGSSASNLLSAIGTVEMSPNTSPTFENAGWWNAGYFGMAELGFQDQLFITLAARVDDNSNLGEEYGRALSPRVGASYVRELGPAELKVRAQWGKGVRPPPPYARAGRVSSSSTIYLPNPDIGPEEKAGWDAGVELYWGRVASLSVTRFDEEANNLIYAEPVDLAAEPQLYQYQNIGVVGIQGWEVEGKVNVGRIMLEANYAYSDNVIREVTDAVAADPNASYKVGDRTSYAPRHSGAGRVTARLGRGSVSVDGSVMAGWRGLDNISYRRWVYGVDPYRGSIRAYTVEYPALWKWNLRAEQAVGERLTAFLRVDNLANN